MTILIVLDKTKAICFDVAQTQFPETKQKGQYRRRLRGSWIVLRPPSQFLFASEPRYHNLDTFSVWTCGLFFFLPFSCSTKGLIKEHEGCGSSVQNCRLRAPLYFEDNGSRPGISRGCGQTSRPVPMCPLWMSFSTCGVEGWQAFSALSRRQNVCWLRRSNSASGN